MVCNKMNMYEVTWSNVERMVKVIQMDLKMSKEEKIKKLFK